MTREAHDVRLSYAGTRATQGAPGASRRGCDRLYHNVAPGRSPDNAQG